LAATCFSDVTVAARSVFPAGRWREREPCWSVAGWPYAIPRSVFFAPAFQYPEDSLAQDLVLESEAFDVGESIDRRLHGDPFDVGFSKVVLFQ
jgi:hypothetical protein